MGYPSCMHTNQPLQGTPQTLLTYTSMSVGVFCSRTSPQSAHRSPAAAECCCSISLYANAMIRHRLWLAWLCAVSTFAGHARAQPRWPAQQRSQAVIVRDGCHCSYFGRAPPRVQPITLPGHPQAPHRVCVCTPSLACLVLRPCVVAPPTDRVRFCPGALACA